ncbi:putative MT-A70 S-adenosylmethionine-binding subunit of mRNA:m6A methyl-transferase [Paratrimastix pyriformis]|uniref:mRNA m(6)A methyltransferase n=1 Tax=Paratrimastix pyriformis TaxID=342808 RepID=A0ABQ8UAI4_9EUKA|nr:putative MT-A70 S-adenosylmethionine-binding subunit of mRNA:m6A methyl-transferase [Paratrimastix pyriformis]
MEPAATDPHELELQAYNDWLLTKQIYHLKSRDFAPSFADLDIPKESARFFEVPPHSVPIQADVRTFDWPSLLNGVEQFEAIVMDPPWELTNGPPSRGVGLSYSTLTVKDIKNMPMGLLQKNGLLFVWVINSTYDTALELFEHWGYRIIGDICYSKQTNSRHLARGHGYYLQHAKETCLVGVKGTLDPAMFRSQVCSDFFEAPRTGQSQKPPSLYEMIEAAIPQGRFLEIFARRTNLRDFWLSIGNEIA